VPYAQRNLMTQFQAHGIGPELIASSPDEFVKRAAGLAADRQRLAELRSGMRERLRASALCDGPAHARRLDSALRQMWRAWCGAA
jgi:predicted O-linked N-acetylglucosamine transferase (SPINDLY family)